MTKVYLDHAATTPMDPAVLEAMRPCFSEICGNPSSLHGFGREARNALETARESVARCLHAQPEEIFFTSGGTESDNVVLQGVTAANSERGNHVITTAIEHPAILNTCHWLEEHGTRVTYLPVDSTGTVDPDAVRHAITDRTVLVSVMYANNEVGTIQPIAAIGRICREAGVPFHTDAVQAGGALPLDVEAEQVDFLSLSGHKFYGPKGIGVLYARRGTRWSNLLYGGGQERHRRPGTENVPGIVGLAKALELATAGRSAEAERQTALRNTLVEKILARVDHCRLNGHPTRRLPNNANISVEFIEGESLLLNLDLAGIAVSSGSACSSGSPEPSHVLRAIGLPPVVAQGTIRFSLGHSTTAEAIDYVVDSFVESVERLRRMSPLYREATGGR